MGDTEIFCTSKLVLEGKTDKEIPESSRTELLETFSANNLLYQMQKTKPVKNISKNVQSFLEISHMQREILLSHKLRDHT